MYKEIVTKAVIGKAKKTFRDKYELLATDKIDTVLGCWVINHKMNATSHNGNVKINGTFDVNIWYSTDNNTKTSVEARTVSYSETVTVPLKENSTLTNNSEIILNSLKNPTVVDVTSTGNKINYEIEKELGIEIIGEAKVKIQIMNDEIEEYVDLDNELTDNEIGKIVDNEINSEYL